VSRHGGSCRSGGNHDFASSQQTGPVQLRVDRVPLATPATLRSHPPAQPTISKGRSIPASTPIRTFAASQPSLPSHCPSPQEPSSASPAVPPLDLRASLPPRPHPAAAADPTTSQPLACPAVRHWTLVPLAATLGQPPLLHLGCDPLPTPPAPHTSRPPNKSRARNMRRARALAKLIRQLDDQHAERGPDVSPADALLPDHTQSASSCLSPFPAGAATALPALPDSQTSTARAPLPLPSDGAAAPLRATIPPTLRQASIPRSRAPPSP
jgi:hypothetical protein